MTKRASPDYGIDGPDVLRAMCAIGLTGAVLSTAAVAAMMSSATRVRTAGKIVACAGGLALCYGGGLSAYMIFDSRVGKLRWRELLLDEVGRKVQWTGRERVLDVGCGRGLMLIGAAHRLTTGEAVGVDIWREQDQSSNSADATLTNARLENVVDRVRVETSDARALPFPDASFDVVLSRWVLHNLDDQVDRTRVIDEMTRVIKPGGVLAIADIANQTEYNDALKRRAFTDIQVSDGGIATRMLGALTGGSFRPMSIVARRT